MKKQYIKNVNAKWNETKNSIELYAEELNGTETLMLEYVPFLKPLFNKSQTLADALDYQIYYDFAVDVAHSRGLIINNLK